MAFFPKTGYDTLANTFDFIQIFNKYKRISTHIQLKCKDWCVKLLNWVTKDWNLYNYKGFDCNYAKIKRDNLFAATQLTIGQ